MRPSPGIALVLCAPSGTGKTTLVKMLLQDYPSFAFSVSCTTRPPRQGEVDGREYIFLDQEEFLRLRDNGYFAEWATVHGHYYGTPLKAAMDLLKAGRDLLFDIDVQGAIQLKKTVPLACFVFILPPSRAELEQRLKLRGSETDQSLALRLANARHELEQAGWFDALIVNARLDEAYADLCAVYRAAKLRPVQRQGLAEDLIREWK